MGTNLGTIAIVQASDDVPLNNFAFELSLALNNIGKLRSFNGGFTFGHQLNGLPLPYFQVVIAIKY